MTRLSNIQHNYEIHTTKGQSRPQGKTFPSVPALRASSPNLRASSANNLGQVSVEVTRAIDDLRKPRGLHSVSAYRSMPAGVAAQSWQAFVGGYSEHVGKMTATRKQKAEMLIKHSLFVGNMQIG